MRKLNSDGRVDMMQTLHNLNEGKHSKHMLYLTVCYVMLVDRGILTCPWQFK